MTDREVLQADCARAVALLAHELGIASEQEAAYAQAIVAYLPANYNDFQIQRLLRCYHHDHKEVQALRDAQHPEYEDAWAKWSPQVLRILRDNNLAWIADSAVDTEDLVQTALRELHRSISNYRFSSRFSTWAYTVILRAAQHVIREQSAAKRSRSQISLDDPETTALFSSHEDDPSAAAQEAALITIIIRILAERGGPQWVDIFLLWAQQDQRLVDIGQQVGLSTGRVSVLLRQMRDVLKQHPDLIEWYRSSENRNRTSQNKEE